MSGKITAATGRIGGFEITQNAITGSGFYLSGSATGDGFFISSSKFNVKANGDVTGSSVLFTGGKFTGTVTAAAGTIGGFTINESTITATGITLRAGTTPSIALGNATGYIQGSGIWLGNNPADDDLKAGMLGK